MNNNSFIIAITIISLIFGVLDIIAIVFTKKEITYYIDNPVYVPPRSDGWEPIDGSLSCIIKNHTYLEWNGMKIIDIYATTNSTKWYYCANQTVRYYGEILQSCRCANASQVNKTVDRDFPIGKDVDCSINEDCTKFQTDYRGLPPYSYLDNNLYKYEWLFILEVLVMMFVIVGICTGISHLVLLKYNRRKYDNIN